MGRIRSIVLSIAWLFGAVHFGWATGNCPQDHCSKIDSAMNSFCIANGMAGKPYMVFGPNGEKCFCPCSCMAANTLIDIADAPFVSQIQHLKMKQKVVAPFADQGSQSIDHVTTSIFDESAGTVRHMRFSNGAELIVSPEHPFVGPNHKVLAAEELGVGSFVLDGMGRQVAVTKNVQSTAFFGKLMNVVLNENSKRAHDHFLVTNSILSGDWLVQSNYASFKAEIDVRMGRIQTFAPAGQNK